jgi:hypothetical protein
LLNVFQSVEVRKPFVDVVACDIVIFGVAPPLEAKGLDAVTLVTPPPPEGLLLVTVKLGYVPLTEIPVPAVKVTTWSGAVFVIVNVPAPVIGLPETLIPVPAEAATEVTVPTPLVFAKALITAILSAERLGNHLPARIVVLSAKVM